MLPHPGTTPTTFALLAQASPSRPLSPNDIFLFVALIALLIGLFVLAILAWNRSLHSRVRDRTSALAAELAERKKAQAALADSEARFRVVLKGSTVMVSNQDRDLRYTWAYNVQRSLFSGDVIGKTDEEVLPHDSAPRLAQLKRSVLQNAKSAVGEIRLEGDAQHRHFTVLIEPLRDENALVVGVTCATVETTPLQQAESHRREVERRAREAQRLESLGIMAGGIAHDFNNLLGGILGNAALLKSDLPPDSPQHEQASLIEHAAKRAGELTHQLMAYSGRGRTRITPVDLPALVSETIPLLRLAHRPALRIEWSAPDSLPRLQADPTQLRQVILNLLKNAIDAMATRDGTIRVQISKASLAQDEIDLADVGSAARPGDFLCLEISDQGVGLDPATRASMFDPFVSTKGPGRGLGLAVVAGIVRRHGGTVHVQSRPSSGSTFRVCLPTARPPAADPTLPMKSANWNDPSRRSIPSRVLIVEDSPEVGAVVARSLQRAGRAVHAVATGEEALAAFDTAPDLYDAAVIDRRLPGVDGLAVYRRLRSQRPLLPVLLTSGIDDSDIAAAIAGDHAAAFLAKPFTPDELLAALAHIHPDAPIL